MQVSEIRFAVRSGAAGADVSRVASIIGSFDVTGLVIDGARVGAPGWVFARTLGDTADETLLYFDAEQDATAFLLPWKTVHDALVDAFGDGVLVGAELDLGNGQKVLENGLFALGGEHASLAVLAHQSDHQFAGYASGSKRALVAARVGEWVAVSGHGRATEADLVENLDDRMWEIAAAAGGRSPALVLWRRGEFTHAALLHKGDVHQRLLWGPDWTVIEPASLHRHELREFVAVVTADLSLGESDGAELIKRFGLDQQQAVHLRALIRRPVADIPGLLEILDLPAVIGEVFTGACSLTDLPQARVFPVRTLKELAKAEFSGNGAEPLPPDPAAAPPGRRWRRGS